MTGRSYAGSRRTRDVESFRGLRSRDQRGQIYRTPPQSPFVPREDQANPDDYEYYYYNDVYNSSHDPNAHVRAAPSTYYIVPESQEQQPNNMLRPAQSDVMYDGYGNRYIIVNTVGPPIPPPQPQRLPRLRARNSSNMLPYTNPDMNNSTGSVGNRASRNRAASLPSSVPVEDDSMSVSTGRSLRTLFSRRRMGSQGRHVSQ
ncbi:hypothetical protein V1511DRAFT_487933 [Dipodascopsis uninucleata]